MKLCAPLNLPPGQGHKTGRHKTGRHMTGRHKTSGFLSGGFLRAPSLVLKNLRAAM
jgi:hypothetical protein